MDVVQKIMQDALIGARIHHLAVRSIVQIDDILSFTKRITGRHPSLAEVLKLERTMGQTAASIWKQ